MRTALLRFYSTSSNPIIHVVLVEPHVLADLVERDATVTDETADESLRGAESLGEFSDTEHRPAVGAIVLFYGPQHHRLLSIADAIRRPLTGRTVTSFIDPNPVATTCPTV